MYAVFEVAGNQYRAEVGEKLQVERLDKQVGDQVEFDKVLMVSDDSGVKVSDVWRFRHSTVLHIHRSWATAGSVFRLWDTVGVR